MEIILHVIFQDVVFIEVLREIGSGKNGSLVQKNSARVPNLQKKEVNLGFHRCAYSAVSSSSPVIVEFTDTPMICQLYRCIWYSNYNIRFCCRRIKDQSYHLVIPWRYREAISIWNLTSGCLNALKCFFALSGHN